MVCLEISTWRVLRSTSKSIFCILVCASVEKFFYAFNNIYYKNNIFIVHNQFKVEIKISVSHRIESGGTPRQKLILYSYQFCPLYEILFEVLWSDTHRWIGGMIAHSSLIQLYSLYFRHKENMQFNEEMWIYILNNSWIYI